ncbi:MAG: secretin N-terminal domain-containing protein [Nitrosomonadales bacterium]|nr:secretin N-terminal domain-containing protein [Nitrosomonadales bacterium]
MRRTLWMLVLVLGLPACTAPGQKNNTAETIRHEMDAAVQESKPAKPEAVNEALLPPLTVPMPRIDSKPLEPRFDLAVNNTPANQVFTAIVSGTRYSMLVPPDINGDISLNLKDVTVFEALEAVRELYGYEYKVDGARIYIQPASMQTRLFQVNYLTGLRKGESLLHISGGSVADAAPSNTSGNSSSSSSSATSTRTDSSKVTMTSSTDFWDELGKSLQAIVGNEKGRSVVVSPMSGVIVVRAMPEELRSVTAYLRASQLSIERQVILEAKILEVQLNDAFQSGVNWGAFKNGPNSHVSAGQLSPGAALSMSGSITNGTTTSIPGTDLSLAASAPGQTAGSLFGLAFQTSNFAALLNFLESQGNVHVLSSPRIATLNDQKAVLKVGTDEFFVTEVSGGTQATTNVAGTAPTVKVQPFFSGIMLDVTPSIDQNNEIILHVHPSVSSVTTVNKTINLGSTMGTYNLPLASSTVSETDSIVRARDGQIVAIGGLMRQAAIDDQSGLPGLPKLLFGQTSKTVEKRELVILLKPTVVDNDKDWSEDITHSRDRMNGLTR